MSSYNTIIPLLTLLSTGCGTVLAQNFIQVAGTGIGTADLFLSGPGGSVSESISINALVFPYQESELRQNSIPSYAQGQINLQSAAGITNGMISVVALCSLSAAANCGELGCAEGESSGTVTSRVTFQVDSPAVLYCQGGNSTILIGQAACGTAGGSADASGTADLQLFGTGVGTQFYRQISGNCPNENNGMFVPAGGVARLIPGIDYRLDLTASANGVASGSGTVGTGYASVSCTFWLTQDTCPTTTDPVSVSVCPTGTAAFSVTPSGSGPFTFQWEVWDNGSWVALTNGARPGVGVVSNATTRTLHVANAVSGNLFRCTVSNICGSATSNFATLTVCPADFNCDGVVDFFDYLDLVDAFAANNPIADFNSDGVIDFFDYLDFVDVFASGC